MLRRDARLGHGSNFDVSMGSGFSRQNSLTPISTLNLVGWFVGDLGVFTDTAKTTPATSEGALIAAWADQSGSGNDYLQASEGDRPALNLAEKNGHNAVEFATKFMRLATPVTMNACTIFIVAKDTADSSVWVSEGDSTNSYVYTSNIVRFKSGSGSQIDTDPITENEWHIAGGRTDGTTANSYHNGDASAGQANTEDFTWAAAGQYNSSALITGQIAEIIIYSRALSASERSAVESYLNAKYVLF